MNSIVKFVMLISAISVSTWIVGDARADEAASTVGAVQNFKDTRFETHRTNVGPLVGLDLSGSHVCALYEEEIDCSGAKQFIGEIQGSRFDKPQQIATGQCHGCAIDEEGLWCWGLTENRRAIIPLFAQDSKEVAARGAITCVISAKDKLGCWGGRRSNFKTKSLNRPRALTMGSTWICLIEDDPQNGEQVACWSYPGYRLNFSLPAAGVVTINQFDLNLCLVRPGNTDCFNLQGGNSRPSRVRPPSDSELLVFGNRFMCHGSDGSIQCDGKGVFGEIPGRLEDVKFLDAHFNRLCAGFNNGQVACWGEKFY